MLEMDVCQATPNTIRRSASEFATMENGVRAACFAIRVWKNVELGACVEHSEHIEFVAARGSREAGAGSIVDGAPKAFGDGILATVILTSGSHLNPVRAVTGDCGLLAGVRV